MGNGAGTMDLTAVEFLPMWGVMMAAMMLPAVAPVATLYARTIVAPRGRRLALFVGGYLLLWVAAGIPAYALLRVVDGLVEDSDSAMRWIAASALAAAGLYQLSPLKSVCLRHCRSPLAQLLHYGNVKGPLRDLKVAVHHAGYCLGCCWALMALLFVGGVMNLLWVTAIAGLVLVEKVARVGPWVGRVAGLALAAWGISMLAAAVG